MDKTIQIYTRSMNPKLYHRAMFLCDLPYEKKRLLNTTAGGYLVQLLQADAEWVLNIDEDAFVFDKEALNDLVDYCIDNGYENCGMPDGGVVHLRKMNPLVTNPYFNLFHVKTIREKLSKAESLDIRLEDVDVNQLFSDLSCFREPYNFHCVDAEPYYPLLLWMSQNVKTLYLNATNHPDGESTVLENHKGRPFLIHTWYSRFYGRDKTHTKRINKAFEECLEKRSISYKEPLSDRLYEPMMKAKRFFKRIIPF